MTSNLANPQTHSPDRIEAMSATKGVIDLAEARAARTRVSPSHVTSQGASYENTAAKLFRDLEAQANMIGEVTSRMVSQLAGFTDNLDEVLEEAREVREFCAACQEALLLNDIEAMEQARDRLAVEYANLEIGARRAGCD
ncbi:hypothetical protein [Skermanella stibiiresistens]|nr:hypothetical protein [Skermanella stibiiresistens]